MPSIFCLQDDQDQGMHRTEYCLSVCLIPIPSMAYCLWWQDPLVHLRPCLDSASVRSRESLVAITAIPLAPISKMCGGICSLCQETTQLVQVWSEKSFLSFSKRFLVAICRAQQRAGCKSIWERFVWNPLQASTVEHSWITLAYDYYPSSNELWWFCLHGFECSCAEIGETNPKLCSEQRRIRSFAGLLKALSLRPTFQPSSTPEQASRLLVKMQRRFLNKRPAIRTAMRNTQSPADLFNWCQAFFVCKMTRIR